MHFLGSLARVRLFAKVVPVLGLIMSDWATGHPDPEIARVVWINPHVRIALFVSLALAPAQTVSLYSVTLELAGQCLGRYLDSAFIGIGVLTWLARNAEPSEGLRAVVLGDFVLPVLGLVVAILHAISGSANALLWSTVVLYLVSTVGFGTFQIVEPAAPR
jgi:hypothetical protein